MAYTSAELCYCYAEEGDEEKVLIHAQQVVKLCERLPYECVKLYCFMKVSRAFGKMKIMDN